MKDLRNYLVAFFILAIGISQQSFAKEECIYPPTAVITKNLSGSTFFSGTTIVFSGTSSDSGNCQPMDTYLWLINGQWSGASTATATFTLPNGVYEQNYTIYLEVENTNGQTDEATIVITIKRPQRVYFVKDHLGSVRTTVSREGTVLAYDDYYPFGLQMPGRSWKNASISDGADNTKFTGYEQDDEAGLDLYHANARGYDPEIGRFLQIDPLHTERAWLSPFNYGQNNPINRVDPSGALDWVLNGDNEIYWDDNANSQATTQAGETYLGKELTFTFNSNIDGSLWDGPGGSAPVGDKLTSVITLSASENIDGQLTGITATKQVQVGSTPIGTARDYFPGLGTDQNRFSTSQSTGAGGTLSNFSLNFEQHASVSPIEGFGLNMMGFDIVNVAQQLNINTSGNHLSISAGTDVFPSASLNVNGTLLFQYNQPSFRATHGRSSTFIDNNMGGVNIINTSRRPKPRFYNRYKN